MGIAEVDQTTCRVAAGLVIQLNVRMADAADIRRSVLAKGLVTWSKRCRKTKFRFYVIDMHGMGAPALANDILRSGIRPGTAGPDATRIRCADNIIGMTGIAISSRFQGTVDMLCPRAGMTMARVTARC